MNILLFDKNLTDPINLKKWKILNSKKNIQINAVTPKNWIENFTSQSLEIESHPFPITQIPVIWPGYENRAFYKSGLSSVFKKNSPDIIIIFEEPFSLFALQLTLLAKKYHPKANLIYFSWYNTHPKRIISYRPKILYNAILKFVLKQANLLLAANDDAVVFYQKKTTIPVKKIYFGVDTESYISSLPNKSLKKEGVHFGYVGKFLESKGLDTLIKAVGIVQENSTNFQVSLLGSGPYKKNVLELIKANNLGDCITIYNSVPSVEVKNYLRSFDVLILPSKTTKGWREQYGRVIIEAMANGIPVIGSSSGAIPEVIGEAGMIFKESNTKDLAQKMLSLINNPNSIKQLSEIATTRVKLFDSTTFANNMYDYLKELHY